MKSAICVENLGKRYRIHHAAGRGGYKTLRESLVGAVSAPLRRWRNGGAAGQTEDFWALKDVSFEVQRGEVLGIIGRNGAGKSTLLKVLSGITKPTTGQVTLHGRVASLLEVGTGFHPELTGRENIYLNGSILGMSRREIGKKYEEIVEFSGVADFIDMPVKRYSSGMQVRLAFSVAAHLEPETLIVDEVLAVGDVEFQEKCLGKMQTVSKSGRTVLLVSHNLAAISRLCDRGICLRAGHVASDGDVETALHEYVGSSTDGSSEFSCGPVKVRASFSNADGQPLAAWCYGETLVADVDVTSSCALPEPSVDLALYAGGGARVFAVQSGHVQRCDRSARRVRFRIAMTNTGICCSQLSVDLGVRASPNAGYVGWWQRVTTIPISVAGIPRYADSDVLMALPTRVEIAAVSA